MKRSDSVMDRIDAVMAELGLLADAGRLRFTAEAYLPRPSRRTIAAIEDTHGPLPSGLAEIYDSVGSIEIEWEARLDGTPSLIRGALKVPAIERMYGDWKDSLWFDSSPPDDVGRTLRPLDRFSPEWWAVLRPGEDQVFLHEAGITDQMRPTGLTVARWLDRTLDARFYDGWLFCCAPGIHLDHHRAEMARDTAALFPGLDLSLFRPLV